MKYFKIFALVFVSAVSAFAAGQWVAEVDNKKITESDLKQQLEYQQILMEMSSGGRNLKAQFQNKQVQAQVLQSAILQDLMVKEIKSMNRTKPFISPSMIKKQMNGISDIIEKSLWLRAYTNNVLRPKISVSQKAVEQFYKKNKDKFSKMETKDAYRVAKEELILRQIQPMLLQVQTKVTSEANLKFNQKYFK